MLLMPNAAVDVWSRPLASDRATGRLWRRCIGCVGAADGGYHMVRHGRSSIVAVLVVVVALFGSTKIRKSGR